MENVYLLRGIISIPAPLFKRGGAIPCNKAEKQSSGFEFGLELSFLGGFLVLWVFSSLTLN